MKNENKWVFAFNLNNENANVGIIYYTEKYFGKDNLVNPKTAKEYTKEEIEEVKKESKKMEFPENALIGMTTFDKEKTFWYDDGSTNKIITYATPLILDAEGNLKNGDEIVAKAI